ncbi:MAG: hypothetical protein QW103_02475 [Candidatus Pacearchaeota archaeon]
MKNYFTKNNLKKFIKFVLVVFIITLVLNIGFAIPKEKQGKNSEELNFSFDVYVVNKEISEEEILNYFEEVKDIWKKYNISLKINSIQNVEINLTEDERFWLYTKIGYKDSEEEKDRICKEFYMPLINKITNNSPNKSIIYVKSKKSGGRGSLCGHNFAIFNKEKILSRDLTGWNLAHEFGHVFGLEDKRNQYQSNLMNDKYKLFFYSSFLNQKQINVVKESIKKMNYE